MKILFTGGGTGGHFYPIIAVAQEIKAIVSAEKLVEPELYFMSTDPYNEELLFENGIKFIQTRAGKWRRYWSFQNFTDLFKTAFGIIQAIFKMYQIYPDLVFSKGGFGSIPAVLAARLLAIPIFIHESDSHPGRANLWAGKFATRIALSYSEAASYFPQAKIAVTGNPLRQEVLTPTKIGAFEFLDFDPQIPVIFIVGGSQGATKINNVILDLLPQLVARYQIIHQTGVANFQEVSQLAGTLLEKNSLAKRYKPFAYLNNTAVKMAAGAASLVISRAGSSIFEIAYWGIPSIIIPLPESISHDQTKNAFTYAKSGSAVIIEENNLIPSVLSSEINRLFDEPKLMSDMKIACQKFAKPEAGQTIAREILSLALAHDRE